MDIRRLLGNIKDPDFDHYVSLKEKMAKGFYIEFNCDGIFFPKDFLEHIFNLRNFTEDMEKDSRNVPFSMKVRAANRKRIYMGGLYYDLEIKGVSDTDRVLLKGDIRSRTDLYNLIGDEEGLYKMKTLRFTFKVHTFDRNYFEEEAYFSDENRSLEYFNMLLSPETINRVLNNYKSSSWLTDRLNMWGVKNQIDIYRKDFGMNNVLQVEEFLTLLGDHNVSSAEILERITNFKEEEIPPNEYITFL